MALNGVAAAAYMSPGRVNEANACLYTVWLAYGSPHTVGSLAGHTFPTAIDAWNYTTKRHYDRNPPEGAAVWFGACAGPRYAGDAHWRDGDVTVARKNSLLGATDYPAFGHIGECTIAQREAQTGRAYLGWSADFIGNDIQLDATAGGNATPIIDHEEAPMGVMYYTTDNDKPSPAGKITEWALAGTSPGTPADWLVTKDQGTATEMAGSGAGGSSVFLGKTSYASFRASYLAPLNIAGGTVSNGNVDVSAIVNAIAALPAQIRAAIIK